MLDVWTLPKTISGRFPVPEELLDQMLPITDQVASIWHPNWHWNEDAP
jgi:hypothetical protein